MVPSDLFDPRFFSGEGALVLRSCIHVCIIRGCVVSGRMLFGASAMIMWAYVYLGFPSTQLFTPILKIFPYYTYSPVIV